MPHHLRTERMVLRPPLARDAGPLAAAISDEAVLRNTGTWPYPATPAYARFRILRSASVDPSVLQSFVMVYGQQVIGNCGVGQNDAGAYELGYMIGRSWWGQGLATEAAAALCSHAFRTLPLDRILAGVFYDNPASMRVLKKIGFRVTGPSKPVWSIARGHYDDGVDFELTRERLIR